MQVRELLKILEGILYREEIQEKLAERNLSLGMTDYSHLKNSIKLSRQKEETDEA